MTQTEYAAEVTELVQLAAGPDFEFPASFDADVAVYCQRRETPEAAAALVVGTDEETIILARGAADREIDRTATTHDVQTVIYQSPGGARLSICTACERRLRDAREWPKDARGEEYCQVHRGRAPGRCDYVIGGVA